ncbi:MAG: isocitrate/isopropylmalate family dehydrogenase [Pseudomonadota bacterium]
MQIAVIEGDDAAPEAMKPSVELLDTLNLHLDLGLDWVYPVVGEQAKLDHGTTFPEEAKKIIDASDTTYFGSTSGSASKALFYLRWGRQTFANVRPCRYLEGARSPLVDPLGIDFVIVRENLEDLYVGIEGELRDLTGLNLSKRSVIDGLSMMGRVM